MDLSSLINLVCGGLINGILSEKTAILSARYKKPDKTTDSNCSAINDTDKKAGGRSPTFETSAKEKSEGDSMNSKDINRNKYLLNSSHLDISLLSGGDQDDSKQKFEWFALNITETQIKIQVIF
jgi:hypothetical protein